MTKGRIAAEHGRFNRIRQVAPMRIPMLASAHPSPLPKRHLDRFSHFWATVCKTVRSMLSVRCPVCLSVCLSVCTVRALWPNGWTDQDET